MSKKELAYVLVGDHLGQTKKVLIPSGDVSVLPGFVSPDKSNPVVSIEALNEGSHTQLIANKRAELTIYDCVHDTSDRHPCNPPNDLNRAIPIQDGKQILFVYDKQIVRGDSKSKTSTLVQQKRGQIKNAKLHVDKLALAGADIPLRLYDITTTTKVFDGDGPEKDYLGIQPDCYVSGLDFVANTKIATCSKSDCVIRVYDTLSKPKPVISIKLDNTAFNEHAEAGRFTSIASTDPTNGRQIVVGSNVGQMFAIDLRTNIKVNPKKRLQPKTFKILGSFKGSRGASIKDIKVVPNYLYGESSKATDDDDDDDHESTADAESGVSAKSGYKVISCSLDRYLRIHNFSRQSRQLEKQIYISTKPVCISPVYYSNI